MIAPRLESGDIHGLKRVMETVRRLHAALDPFSPTRQMADIFQAQLNARETELTPTAKIWYELVPFDQVREELAHWFATLNWRQTRQGWSAYRLIVTRRVYGTKPVITRASVKHAGAPLEYVRLSLPSDANKTRPAAPQRPS